MTYIKKLEHSCFGSLDLEQTKLFYCGLLGLKVSFEFRNDANELYGIFIDAGEGTRLEFFSTNLIPYVGLFRHISFEVHDIFALWNSLREHGHMVEDVKRGRRDRVLQFFIRDPDGMVIEFQQPDDESRLALKQFKQAGTNG